MAEEHVHRIGPTGIVDIGKRSAEIDIVGSRQLTGLPSQNGITRHVCARISRAGICSQFSGSNAGHRALNFGFRHGVVENGHIVDHSDEVVVAIDFVCTGANAQHPRGVQVNGRCAFTHQFAIDIELLGFIGIGCSDVGPLTQGRRGTCHVVPAGPGPEVPGVVRLDVDDVALLGRIVPRTDRRAVAGAARVYIGPETHRELFRVELLAVRDVHLIRCTGKLQGATIHTLDPLGIADEGAIVSVSGTVHCGGSRAVVQPPMPDEIRRSTADQGQCQDTRSQSNQFLTTHVADPPANTLLKLRL